MSRLVLTMDDIPQKVTKPIVDYLTGMAIPAVFFAVGDRLEQDMDTAVYALRKGFWIGNHSYSHPAFSGLSYEEGVREIERTEDLLNRVYAMAGVERRAKLFRFPYLDKGGDNRERFQKYLADAGFDKLSDEGVTAPGYRSAGWDREIDTACSFDAQEYNIPAGTMTIEDVMRRLAEGDPGMGSAIRGKGDQIVLIHSHDDTEALVPGYYQRMIGEILLLGGNFVKPEIAEK